ncbi:hypothetical protein C8F04DRAFT_1180352 [Mycena alexandri]|uniref:Uncharacterized protein n=1 Tax=Mycena alexandri TaxID=1745969 RepID=A0AAD6X5Q5_9AGAR|nr:hypothetical protein C8F04DRAFT_1180352 [Mycena alexandri]
MPPKFSQSKVDSGLDDSKAVEGSVTHAEHLGSVRQAFAGHTPVDGCDSISAHRVITDGTSVDKLMGTRTSRDDSEPNFIFLVVQDREGALRFKLGSNQDLEGRGDPKKHTYLVSRHNENITNIRQKPEFKIYSRTNDFKRTSQVFMNVEWMFFELDSAERKASNRLGPTESQRAMGSGCNMQQTFVQSGVRLRSRSLSRSTLHTAPRPPQALDAAEVGNMRNKEDRKSERGHRERNEGTSTRQRRPGTRGYKALARIYPKAWKDVRALNICRYFPFIFCWHLDSMYEARENSALGRAVDCEEFKSISRKRKTHQVSQGTRTRVRLAGVRSLNRGVDVVTVEFRVRTKECGKKCNSMNPLGKASIDNDDPRSQNLSLEEVWGKGTARWTGRSDGSEGLKLWRLAVEEAVHRKAGFKSRKRFGNVVN